MLLNSLLAFCLLVTPLSAQVFPAPPLPTPEPYWTGMESPFLYFQLPHAIEEDQTILQFHIHVNGQAYAAEILSLPPTEGGESIELLAKSPLILKHLYELAEEGNQVTVSVVFSGFEAWMSWSQLVDFNRDLKVDPSFLPIADKDREVITFDEDWAAKNASAFSGLDCRDRCYQDYLACAIDTCGQPLSLCEPCLTQYSGCLRNCCIASTTTYTQTTIISTVVEGSECLAYFYPSATTGNVYQIKRRTYKVETIQETTDTYCITTQTVIATSYYSRLCDVLTTQTCSNPISTPTCNW